MILSSILVSAACALLFSLLLVYGLRRKVPGPLNGTLFLFLILFMFTWAIGSWLVPVGPVHWGGTLMIDLDAPESKATLQSERTNATWNLKNQIQKKA